MEGQSKPCCGLSFERHLFESHWLVLSHRYMHNDLLFRILGQREPVFLDQVTVSKVAITYAQLLARLYLPRCLKANEALILYFVMETCNHAVWLKTVVDIIQQRHHHKDWIRICCVLISGIVKNKISATNDAKRPAPLFKVNRHPTVL